MEIHFLWEGNPTNFPKFQRIVAVGFGKAAGTMAEPWKKSWAIFLKKAWSLPRPAKSFP
jgi:glycerate-2-kinase